ncbi:MAG: phage antirepressor [Ruminococcus sp.]|nr:phage antirepressor [Ruminococcus sp.]
MNNIKIFENPEFGSVRTVEVSGEPYFVGKDVAEILGYSNPQKALRDHIDDEDKTLNESFTVNGTMAVLVNESGLYSLIISSKLPKAKEFKRWVTSEILPSIRKHGAYMTPDVLSQAISDPDFMIGLFAELKAEQQKRQQLETKVAADKPKVLFADAVETAQTSILIGDLAKLLKQNGVDMGQKRLFAWLRDNGYLMKGNTASRNMPTQKSMELGLFEVKERTINNPDGSIRVTKTPKVTGKGQTYFIGKFLGG